MKRTVWNILLFLLILSQFSGQSYMAVHDRFGEGEGVWLSRHAQVAMAALFLFLLSLLTARTLPQWSRGLQWAALALVLVAYGIVVWVTAP